MFKKKKLSGLVSSNYKPMQTNVEQAWKLQVPNSVTQLHNSIDNGS